MIKSISIKELLPIIEQVNLIDIRTIAKYNDNHIPGAINIQMEDLMINPSKYISKNKRYYIYCQKGLASTNLVSILLKLGYDVVSVSGGYEGWLLEK